MRALIITSCTAKKKYDYLDKIKCSAIDMYQGSQHLLIKQGYLNYLNYYNNLDMIILSAGYGILNPNDIISSYNISFNGMSDTQIKERSNYLNITNDFNNIVKNYEVIFFCLGLNYLKSIDFSQLDINDNQKFFIFSSFNDFKQLTYLKNYYIIQTGKQEAIDYSYGIIGLKGYLFNILCDEMIKDDTLLDSLYNHPELIFSIFERYKKLKKSNITLSPYKKVELF